MNLVIVLDLSPNIDSHFGDLQGVEKMIPTWYQQWQALTKQESMKNILKF